MEQRELADLLSLSSWYLVIVVWLFLTMPRVCLQFVSVVFPDHTHLLFLNESSTPHDPLNGSVSLICTVYVAPNFILFCFLAFDDTQ